MSDVCLRHQLDHGLHGLLECPVAANQELNVDIPDADYPRLRSVNEIVAYIEAKTPVGRRR